MRVDSVKCQTRSSEVVGAGTCMGTPALGLRLHGWPGYRGASAAQRSAAANYCPALPSSALRCSDLHRRRVRLHRGVGPGGPPRPEGPQVPALLPLQVRRTAARRHATAWQRHCTPCARRSWWHACGQARGWRGMRRRAQTLPCLASAALPAAAQGISHLHARADPHHWPGPAGHSFHHHPTRACARSHGGLMAGQQGAGRAGR